MTSPPPRIGESEFRGTVLKRAGTWVVAFLADWCPFCREFEPRFAELGESKALPVLCADLTSLESPLWERFDIQIVPTVLVFREGKTVFRADGRPGEGLDDADLARVQKAAGAGGAALRSGGSPRG